MDPTQHLSFLPRSQGAWASGRGAGLEREKSITTSSRRLDLAIDRAAVKAVVGDDIARRAPSRTRSNACVQEVSRVL